MESFITRSPCAARISSIQVQVCQSCTQIRKYQLRVIQSALDVIKNKDHTRVLRSNVFKIGFTLSSAVDVCIKLTLNLSNFKDLTPVML